MLPQLVDAYLKCLHADPLVTDPDGSTFSILYIDVYGRPFPIFLFQLLSH
jgi:hypothetical protein